MLVRTGSTEEKLNCVRTAIWLFALTYQYAGVKLAIFKTVLPNNSIGTNTPLIKHIPRLTTLVTAEMAVELLTKLPIRKLMLAQQKAKINEFSKK